MNTPIVLNPHIPAKLEYNPWRYAYRISAALAATVGIMLALAWHVYPLQPFLAVTLAAAIVVLFLVGTTKSAIIFTQRAKVTVVDFSEDSLGPLAYAFTPLAYAIGWFVIAAIGLTTFLVAV